jgi:glycerol-3-phosphate acyltransferase PlsY
MPIALFRLRFRFELLAWTPNVFAVPVLSYFVTALIAYLLGSIPTGFLAAKSRGIDIRTVGSGNIGATNAFRILGKRAGILVLLVDALKGWAAVSLVPPLVLKFLPGVPVEYLRLAAAICAILGHNYTCWLKFKGGKGIATTAGVVIALVPLALVIVLSIWIILVFLTRYVSVASMTAAFALPFATWFTKQDVGLTAVTGAMGALAIYKHRKNIQRLRAGTENRISFKKETAR